MLVFCVMRASNMVGEYQCLRETYSLLLRRRFCQKFGESMFLRKVRTLRTATAYHTAENNTG